MRCSKCSHISEYAALSALLFLAFYSPQRVTQVSLELVSKRSQGEGRMCLDGRGLVALKLGEGSG